MTDLKKIIDEELESMTFNELRKRRSLKMKRNFKIKRVTAVCAAAIAAVVIVGGTVCAVTGRFDEFFGALSRSEIYDTKAKNNLPSIGGNTADMSEYYSYPVVNFETDGSVSAELLGLYGDSSTLMLSIMITPQNGVDISNMDMPFYFKLKKSDGTEKFLFQSGMSDPQKFTSADVEGSYCLTFYLTEPDMAGGTLLIESDGIYTKEQTSAVWKKLYEYDEQRRAAGGGKEYYTDENVQKSYERERAYSKAVAPDVTGAVSAVIEIPPSRTESIELNAHGISAKLDSLSLYVSDVPAEYKSDRYAGTTHTIYLKDGSIITDNAHHIEDIEPEIDTSRVIQFPYLRGTNVKDGTICCFDRPIASDEIEKILVSVTNYDTEYNKQITKYVIYGE